jgi:Na+-transporting methylmalonyl-CoA/oxaloacetate decarboxylase gamma subunit
MIKDSLIITLVGMVGVYLFLMLLIGVIELTHLLIKQSQKKDLSKVALAVYLFKRGKM